MSDSVVCYSWKSVGLKTSFQRDWGMSRSGRTLSQMSLARWLIVSREGDAKGERKIGVSILLITMIRSILLIK